MRVALVRGTQSDHIDYLFGIDASRRGTSRRATPLPVPVKLVWTVTLRDADTGEGIRLDRDMVTLRAAFELDTDGGAPLTKHPAPVVMPNGSRQHWITTIPERGWLARFRTWSMTGSRAIAAVSGATALDR
ncbi:MAG TPA: hypothetical protein VJO33_09550 [Gemmatimonadaceae bacterium]|nr:hypothetical protein [Gemmatimonadaceae bacterium]